MASEAVPRMSAAVRAWLVVALVTAVASSGGAEAAERLRVVATIPDLKALTEEVGGNLVEVDALVRGTQNPHDLEARPSLMVKVRNADVLVINGLDLDNWAEAVVLGANNPRVILGAPGRIDASQGIPVLEVPTTRVDRSMGDVHPLGNPHYTLDPGLMPIVTQNILDGLARVAPAGRATFAANRQAFLGRLESAMVRWTKDFEPFRGLKVVSYHNQFIYFLTRFKVVQIGTVEDRAGIPPTPTHLAQLIRRMRDEKVTRVLLEPWDDRKLAARVAEESGAQVIPMAAGVGAVKGADTYIEVIDYNVRILTRPGGK